MRTMRAAFAASALFILSGAAHADDAAVKKTLQAKYNGFIKAFLAKDAGSISKLAAPGFTSRGPDGTTMDAKSSMAMLTEQMKQTPPGTKMEIVVTKVAVKGNKAIAHTKSTMSMKGPGPDKKTHTMVMKSTSEDTWTKIGSDWKILQTSDKPESMTMDGKRMNAGGPVGAPSGGGRPPQSHTSGVHASGAKK